MKTKNAIADTSTFVQYLRTTSVECRADPAQVNYISELVLLLFL